MDRFHISGAILQKISKRLYFKNNIKKNLFALFVSIKFKRFSHVMPVASFTLNFVRTLIRRQKKAKNGLKQQQGSASGRMKI